MKKQFIEHKKDDAIAELWNACICSMPEYNSLEHLENAKNLYKDNYGLTREFIKQRLNYYRKHNYKIYGYDNYISDFDVYFNPKKFFNSLWVKKCIKEII
jgi:hypothetical protein|tara:strand:- start:195 stop:494 length:300 start_codon:yes stop_codon:yes gene_type:complete